MGYRNYSTANSHIVSQDNNGDFATIQAAITAATAPATIFVRDGLYTENLTLKAGVNIVSFNTSQGEFLGAPSTANVKIKGKLSASFSGSCWISGVCIETNGDYAVEITGNNITDTFFQNCNFNAVDFSLINFTCTQNSRNYFMNCNADLNNTGIAFISNASGVASDMRIIGGEWANDGGSTTPSTLTTLQLTMAYVRFFNRITTSSSGIISIAHSSIFGPIITGGSGTSNITSSGIQGFTDSALSVGAGTTVNLFMTTVGSSNTNAITGAGTINYGAVSFNGTSSVVNTTTKTPVAWPALQGGTGLSLPGTSGKVLIGNGTAFAESTPTYPSASGTTRKILVSDGTNNVYSTETYAVPSTSGNVMTSDGTNWTSAAAPGGGILRKTQTLTNAQIKALHGTPISCIAAPGAGKVIVILSIWGKLIYGGTNIFTAGASQTIGLYYGTTIPTNSFANVMSNLSIVKNSSNYCSNSSSILDQIAIASLENVALNFYNPVATEISGNAANNNTIAFDIQYYVINI